MNTEDQEKEPLLCFSPGEAKTKNPKPNPQFTSIWVPMTLPGTCILLICFFLAPPLLLIEATLTMNLTLPYQHPDPEAVVEDVQRRIKSSIARRELLYECQTGNPIDDCWQCDPNWATTNRQSLADCSIGFGAGALGGKGGQIYVVTDSSDLDAAHPTPGTLRFGVIQEEPLWIVFSTSMTIVLKHELIFNSYKTVDGRGAVVRITGHGCLTLQYISNVIIHNVQVSGCRPSGNTIVASSPSHAGWRGRSDGDGISIFGSRSIWIDHCTLSDCADGLVDAIMGSTAITVSNCYFSHHNEVMLLGHDDRYVVDSGMQVTIAFNRFGEKLVQRMPRCRRGYIHVVNNDFMSWEMYAIGGSASPTINSQGNRYSAPADPNAKEVTKRVDTDEGEWEGWNWRTDGDIMVNGAFFVPSGAGLSSQYAKASSLEPKSAALADQLTLNAGVFGGPTRNDDGGFNGGGASPSNGFSTPTPGGSGTGVSTPGGSGGEDDGFFGMIFGNGSPQHSPSPTSIIGYCCLYLLIILSLSNVANDNHVAFLLLPLQ